MMFMTRTPIKNIYAYVPRCNSLGVEVLLYLDYIIAGVRFEPRLS